MPRKAEWAVGELRKVCVLPRGQRSVLTPDELGYERQAFKGGVCG